MLMTTYKFLRIDPFYEMDEKSRYIGEVLDWYRGEDVGENLTCLNALEGEFWKSDQKVVTDEKSWKTWKR